MGTLASRIDTRSRTGLGWLLGARLLLAGLSLGLAVAIDRIDASDFGTGLGGVYWTIVIAFMATIVSAQMIHRTQDPARFATLQVAIDLSIVTSLVYFSGGGESVFTFLYALVVLYGALVLDRHGVAFCAAFAAAGYGFVLFGAELGWLPLVGSEGRDRPISLLGAYWGFYAGALLVLGMLANTLAAELRRTGAALDRRTTDLRRLRDLHLRTVESIGSGLMTTDRASRVTSFNPEAERITGLSALEAMGRALEDVIPGASEIVGAVGDSADSAAAGAEAIGRDRLGYQNERGEALFLGLAASSLRDEEGEQVGHVVIFQDVTAVVSMEQELRRSERLAAVGEMAARIAHEIRNPLASISGSVQLLQSGPRGADPDPEHDRLMGIVVREVDRLNILISGFLRYSRPAPIKPEPVDLREVVEEVATIGGAQVESELEIALELDPTLVVMADPLQLKAILWNLWNNAIQAMGARGRLDVRAHRGDRTQAISTPDRKGRSGGTASTDVDPQFAILEIEDSGPGIPPEVLESIFEPFFTTKQEGSGLGLATVQRLVEQHAGTIQVESRVGVGTVVRVAIPLAEAV